MTDRSRLRLAWRDGDIVMVSLTTLVGGIVIMAGWFGASGRATPSQQAPWLQLAIAGFAVSGVGQCLWLLRGRRAVGDRRLTLVLLNAGSASRAAEPPAQVATPGSASSASLVLVRAAGMTRVHLADCPLMAGKTAVAANLSDGEPCGICRA